MTVHACVAHQLYQSTPIRNEKRRGRSQVTLSGMCLTSIPSTVIENRQSVEKLVLDNNFLNENAFNMPKFSKLRELSVRNNKIRNIGIFISNVQRSCPNLEILRIEDNPGWPRRAKEQERMLIVKTLRSLRVLDESDTHRQKRHSGCSVDSKTSSGTE